MGRETDDWGDPLHGGPEPHNVPGWAMVAAPRGAVPPAYTYTVELGEEVARLYGDNEPGGLWALHNMSPDRVPPPHIVRNWCKQFPAFGLRMKEAEKLRAECMLEQTVVIADTSPGAPARVALQISTRQHMAARLDPARYGNNPGNAPASLAGPSDAQPVAIDVDDATLAQLALSGRPEVAA